MLGVNTQNVALSNSSSVRSLACALVLLIMMVPHDLGWAGVEEDLNLLRKDMAEMKKDVAEIKALLKSAIKPRPQLNTTATVNFAGRPTQGQANAPVTIVEFSDYQCPFCQRYWTSVYRTIKRDYIETGKVRYVFRDFPLKSIHPQAVKAHEAAHCAGEHGQYWEMHDLLFTKQKELAVPSLKQYAQTMGIQAEAFADCLESGRYASDIDQDIAAGTKAGVRGTPSFIIGRSGSGDTITGTVVRGAQPLATFQRVIQEAKNPPAPKGKKAQAAH